MIQQHWMDQLDQLVREAEAAGSLDAAGHPAQPAFELNAHSGPAASCSLASNAVHAADRLCKGFFGGE